MNNIVPTHATNVFQRHPAKQTVCNPSLSLTETTQKPFCLTGRRKPSCRAGSVRPKTANRKRGLMKNGLDACVNGSQRSHHGARGVAAVGGYGSVEAVGADAVQDVLVQLRALRVQPSYARSAT